MTWVTMVNATSHFTFVSEKVMAICYHGKVLVDFCTMTSAQHWGVEGGSSYAYLGSREVDCNAIAAMTSAVVDDSGWSYPNTI